MVAVAVVAVCPFCFLVPVANAVKKRLQNSRQVKGVYILKRGPREMSVNGVSAPNCEGLGEYFHITISYLVLNNTCLMSMLVTTR